MGRVAHLTPMRPWSPREDMVKHNSLGGVAQEVFPLMLYRHFSETYQVNRRKSSPRTITTKREYIHYIANLSLRPHRCSFRTVGQFFKAVDITGSGEWFRAGSRVNFPFWPCLRVSQRGFCKQRSYLPVVSHQSTPASVDGISGIAAFHDMSLCRRVSRCELPF